MMKNLRNSKISILSKDHFKKIVFENILHHIPSEYVENFSINRKIISQYVNKNLKLVIVRCPVIPSTVNRFFLSEVAYNNGKILSMQHGGGYGARDILGVEQLEIDMCDKYLTWGWSSKSKTIHPFFHSQNYWIKKYPDNIQSS